MILREGVFSKMPLASSDASTVSNVAITLSIEKRLAPFE